MAATTVFMVHRTLCCVAKLSDHFSHLGSSVFPKCYVSKTISNTSTLLGSCMRSRSTCFNRSTYSQASQHKLQTRVSQQLCTILPATTSQSNSLQSQINQSKPFHTSCLHRGLEEFFDDPKTYGESDVKSGRPWSVDELRLKDYATLHKLWYVLLKEKNMLMTMDTEAEKLDKLMPGPDRLSKVEKSMKNLQQVVRERNEALTELKMGHPEQHPGKMMYTPFGYLRYIKPREHYVPMYANKHYHRKRYRYKPFVHKYMRLWMEKEQRLRIQDKRRRHNQIQKLKRRFPDADVWQEN